MRGYRYRRATFDLGIKQTATDRGWWGGKGVARGRRSSEMSTRANTPGLFLSLIARFFAGARPTIDLHFKGSPA